MAGLLSDLLPESYSSGSSVMPAVKPAANGSDKLREPLIPRMAGPETGGAAEATPRRLIMSMIFIEAIGVYGLIVALFLIGK